jgi:ferrochelatase
VARHYERVGGKSPINELTFRQARALAELLDREGPTLPVYVGMRYWHPLASDTVKQMMRDGVRRAAGLIMAAHDSGEASWGKYVNAVTKALDAAGPGAPLVEYVPACYDHPDFIAAVAEQIRPHLDGISSERRRAAPLVFTAHSIPSSIAAVSPYVRQLQESCRLVAETLGHSLWSLAYQSRSGDPRQPWLEPDVSEVLRRLSGEGCRSVVLSPIGFVCDHVEVLFDLDLEAKALATSLGIELKRASAVNDHPLYIRALADLVRQKVRQG